MFRPFSPDSSRNAAVKKKNKKKINNHLLFHLPLLVWLIWRPEMCLSLWSICSLDGGVYTPSCWHGNKWRMTGGWRSSSYGFFNLPDASHWQRLITRWHGAVMVTLSHLFVSGWRVWGGGGVGCTCVDFRCVCVLGLNDSMLPLLPLVKVLLRVGLLSLSTRSPAASLMAAHHPDQSKQAQQRVRVARCGPRPPGWAITHLQTGDRALSQSSSTGLPLAFSVLGKRFPGAPVCEL